MANLVVDIGNSSTKLGVFNNNRISATLSVEKFSVNHIRRFLKNQKRFDACILSSVTKVQPGFISELKSQSRIFVRLSDKTPLPFINKYKTPLTLGNDRMANAAAACLIFPNKNVLVIDAGTCLKFDFIDAKKKYNGGSISPGLKMRFKALKKFTRKLPLVEQSNKVSFTGQSTIESIRSGVQYGMIMEIAGCMRYYVERHKNLVVVLTGGDAPVFANLLKSFIFAAPNFTLTGLNAILSYNVQQKA